MSFDKIKAMRNAERFLAQGKIRAAINEYKRVVESDPKDFSTLNMLGDLYAKSSDTQEAVKCFNLVAEYYGKQGFSQKAIAIYNKISRLSPGSLEISAKLAELYQMKGSVAEARSHYTVLAEQYQRKGNKAEALSVFKQIAQLDPNNSDIHLKIADMCLQEHQSDEAASAFIEAGIRLSSKKQYESAIIAYNNGLELRPNDLTGLKGIVTAQISMGYTDEAAKTLEKVLENEPHNREVIFLLADCYLDTNNPTDAERIVIQLVEREPANYLKLIDVVKSYLKSGNLDSAVRVLQMTSEHLLVGGQSQELEKWVNEILARNPEQVQALRLLAQVYSWQRDESQLKDSLERLSEAAHLSEAVEDERYALTQLVIMFPHATEYAQRLQEINEAYGYVDVHPAYQPAEPTMVEPIADVPVYETFAIRDEIAAESYSGTEFELNSGEVIVDYATFTPVETFGNGSNGNGSKEFSFSDGMLPTVVEDYGQISFDSQSVEITAEESFDRKLDPFEEARLQQEIESVEFYISQGYTDLATQSLDLLESELGRRSEIDKLRQSLNLEPASVAQPETEQSFIFESTQPEIVQPEQTFAADTMEIMSDNPQTFDIMGEFRDEMGLEEPEAVDEGSDYDTHYHLGIAYKEMGLMEDSIREFQDAINLVSPNDGTQRFFLCCNLLGHCFMDKQMPNLALMWYKRCLETANLTNDERQGLRYEVANAYETGGDEPKAIEYFEGIYVENVDYRDVAERLNFLRASQV